MFNLRIKYISSVGIEYNIYGINLYHIIIKIAHVCQSEAMRYE
jgi:hypothetical protein